MSGPYLLSILLSIPLLVLTITLVLEKKKTKKIASKLQTLQKNSQNVQTLIKNAENSPQPGQALENVIDSLVSNLQTSYPYSSLSSVIVKGRKIIFKTTVKESVNRAFIEHIRDSMTQSLYKPENLQFEIEESMIGAPVDDLSTSSIMSSFDIKFTVNDKIVAVINLSSTTPNLYSASDTQTFNSISEIISVFLTKTNSLLEIEKSKTLSMIDSFSEGIFMIDKNQELVSINNAALNFLNIHKSEPNSSDVFSALPNIYNFKDKINTCIGLNKQIIEKDVPIIDKTFRIILTPVLETNSAEKIIIGVSFLLQDTTLEKSLAHLKEDFTNIMVHELRSPITAIKASSEFLQSRADFTDEEKKQLMHMISESSKKMLDKIALILDSAKMEAGLFSIKKTPSDLKKLIIDRVNVFTPVAQEKSIILKIDLDEGLPNFPFDPMRIDEVINNLLSNSLKFTPDGGLIQVSTHQVDDKVKVSVSDTGVGIAKDKQHLLFSKFQQAPTSGQNQGTGLGLYVVRGVVEAHSGTVELNSNDGTGLPAGRQGTTISFTLPITESAPAFVLPTAPKVINPMSN